MSNYPAAVDEYRVKENLPGQTYDVNKKTTLYVEDLSAVESACTAIQETLGINPQGAAVTVDARIDALETALAAVPQAIADAVTAAKSALMPVGTIYTNGSNTTNPGTLLGFGTWVPEAQGRVLVGKAPSGTFSTLGATMGAETVAISTAQMPTHNHSIYDPGHTHSIESQAGGYDAVGWSDEGYQRSNNDHYTIVNNRNCTTAYTGISTQNAGSGQAHNNIQPSLVAMYWRRTA